MSCSGCRVLRKPCTSNCGIRPCLEWIKTAESQLNATYFLAKIYGRAGLLNLIHSASENLRPALFRSVLYEACGRMVSPVYGSIGLLWTGDWHLCEGAVEDVLRGLPVANINTNFAAHEGSVPPPMMEYYDVQRVYKTLELLNCRRVGTARTPLQRPAVDVMETIPEREEHKCLVFVEAGESSRGSLSATVSDVEEEEEEMDLSLSLDSMIKPRRY